MGATWGAATASRACVNHGTHHGAGEGALQPGPGHEGLHVPQVHGVVHAEGEEVGAGGRQRQARHRVAVRLQLVQLLPGPHVPHLPRRARGQRRDRAGRGGEELTLMSLSMPEA